MNLEMIVMCPQRFINCNQSIIPLWSGVLAKGEAINACCGCRGYKGNLCPLCSIFCEPAAAAKSLQSCPTLWPHRRQPTRLPHPWDSPGKNTGVGCHCLLQCMKVTSESEVAQSCPTLSDLKNCSPPGPSSHGIFQARVLEWDAIAFSVCEPKTTLKHKVFFFKN